MRIQITALALAALLPLGALQAAESGKNQPHQGRWQKNDRQWVQTLKLDEAQQQQFNKKQEAYRQSMQERRNTWQQHNSKQREEHFKKQQALQNKHHADLRKLLNNEQKALFDKRLAQQKSRHQAHFEHQHKGKPQHQFRQGQHKGSGKPRHPSRRSMHHRH